MGTDLPGMRPFNNLGASDYFGGEQTAFDRFWKLDFATLRWEKFWQYWLFWSDFQRRFLKLKINFFI